MRPTEFEIATVVRGVTGDPRKGLSICFHYRRAGADWPGYFVQELTDSEAMWLEDALYMMRRERSKVQASVEKEKPPYAPT